jgi:hypothetical protein
LANADKLLEVFPESVAELMRLFPTTCQRCVFTPSLSDRITTFANTHLKKPVLAEMKEGDGALSDLDLGYTVVDTENRFLLLYTFLKKNILKKCIVLFTSHAACNFAQLLLRLLKIDALNLLVFATFFFPFPLSPFPSNLASFDPSGNEERLAGLRRQREFHSPHHEHCHPKAEACPRGLDRPL